MSYSPHRHRPRIAGWFGLSDGEPTVIFARCRTCKTYYFYDNPNQQQEEARA